MMERLHTWLRWMTVVAVALTLWGWWQLHTEVALRQTLKHTESDAHRRVTRVRAELAQVQRTARGTLVSLSHAERALQRVVQQLQQRGLAVTVACQEQTAITLATLALTAVPCEITLPPTSMLSLVEVLTAIEQMQVVLQRVRVHMTDGTTIEVQVIGPLEHIVTQTVRREER